MRCALWNGFWLLPVGMEPSFPDPGAAQAVNPVRDHCRKPWHSSRALMKHVASSRGANPAGAADARTGICLQLVAAGAAHYWPALAGSAACFMINAKTQNAGRFAEGAGTLAPVPDSAFLCAFRVCALKSGRPLSPSRPSKPLGAGDAGLRFLFIPYRGRNGLLSLPRVSVTAKAVCRLRADGLYR